MHKTSALGRVLELLVVAALAATADDAEAESARCAEVAFIQSARSLFHNLELAEQKARFQSFMTMLSTASTSSLKELKWQVLRTFPAVEVQANPACSNIGGRFPTLVSRNQSLLDAYATYACGDAADYFVTDPARSLSAELAPLEGGCINLHNRWSTIRATFASNESHGEYLHRDCPESCLQEEFWHQLPTQVVDHDLLVLPSIPGPPGMGYQHSLIDFLPQAWTVLDLLWNSSTKLVVHSSLPSHLLASLGFPTERILEVPPLTDEQPAMLLCAKKGRTMHLWRAGGGSRALPSHPYQDSRVDGDLWHRLIDIQVGPEISDAIAQYNGFVEEPFAPRLVVFLQRCTDRRTLENEQAALEAISRALVKSNRPEELLSMCAGREDFLEQVQKVRRARLIVGAHGGAMANMVLARPDTGVIELVGDAAAQKGLEGLWPPYKSNFYGGLGAAFPFYRVVLYEADPHGKLWIRLDDLQTAVTEFLDRL
ncbi:unnamed protein product [Symbiodinium natans]|uniref:Glycosyltransferase 61 catalytic domain-containing protein n=1 Tax=Symbiodinium natans TaxID=878477 RepID=A0A812J4S6_9DINO|nr:unnamed protein product [Symbiodinium natans]